MSTPIKTLVIMSLLPYLSFIEFPMDTAPYAIVFLITIALPAIYLSRRTTTINGLDILITTLLATFVIILAIRLLIYTDLDSFRTLGNYGAFFCFFVFFLLLSKSDYKYVHLFFSSLSALIFISSFVYITGSLLQLSSRISGIEIFYDITKSVLSRDGRTSFNRGFNSFTAEPSYAGIVCSLLGCMSIFLYKIGYMNSYRCKISFFNYITVVALSASATAIPFFFISVIYAAKAANLKTRCALAILLTLTMPVIIFLWHSLSELRLINLIGSTFGSGGSSVFDDESALSRFGSIINYSLPLFSANGLLGNALSHIDDKYFIDVIGNSGLSRDISAALEVGAIAEGGGLRTKSAISQSLFLFGIFSPIFWIALSKRLIKTPRRRPSTLVILFIIFTGYLIQIPFGHPTFCVAIGMIIMSRKINTNA